MSTITDMLYTKEMKKRLIQARREARAELQLVRAREILGLGEGIGIKRLQVYLRDVGVVWDYRRKVFRRTLGKHILEF